MISTIKNWFFRWKGYAVLTLNDKTLAPRFHIGTLLEAEKILGADKEIRLLETFLEEIRPGDTVFDIGANIGLYTLPSALKLLGTGVVYAFEPAPLWFRRLRENLELNKLGSAGCVVPYNLGFSQRDETCDLVMKKVQGSGMGSITRNYREQFQGNRVIAVPVRLVQGDSFLLKEGIPPANLVKIDVEGAESAVLQGLEKTLRHRACRFILCEVHPQFMSESPGEVEKLLREYGYSCQISQQQRSEYHILARKHPA